MLKSIFSRTIYNNNKNNNIVDYSSAIPFVPPIYSGMVIKVYDGDTFTIASKLPYDKSPLYKFSVRLNNIDCPEMKSNDPNEKECAKLAKEELTNLILNKVVSLKNLDNDKYGRILADVFIDNIHINEHMIKKRLAVYYDGGTKIVPNNWLEYHAKEQDL
jgi:micrococcal nuclease